MNCNRDIALDCFRGIAVLGMVLVNNPGSWSYIYLPLRHPTWDGLSLADLVFPFFILALGMSIPLAFERRLNKGESRFQLIQHIFYRTFFLIGAGLFLNAFPHFTWEELRILGVLQRIGLVYFFCSLLYLFLPNWVFIYIILAIFLIYTGITLWIPAWDRPLLEGWTYNPDNHFGAALDRFLIGEKHLWKFTKTYDPEGIFSTFPAIAQGLMGVLWKSWKFKKENSMDPKDSNPRHLMIVGICLFLGLLWHYILPINKTLWTPSFALVTSSFGFGLYLVFLNFFNTKVFTELYAKDGFGKKLFLDGILFPMGRHALFVFIATGILSRVLVMDFYGIVPKKILWDLMSNSISNLFLASFLYAVGYCIFTIFLVHVYMGFLSFLPKKK